MRFVAQFVNYAISITPGRKRMTEYGVDVIEEPIEAEFSASDWNQRDYETAILSFKFRGIQQYEDEATPVSPASRIAVYDTDLVAEREGWDDEMKSMVEQRMLNSSAHGRDYVLVTELALEPPWPTYDLFDGKAQALAEQVLVLGYDPDEVIAYESSKWGQQREDVVSALQAAVEARETGDIVVT